MSTEFKVRLSQMFSNGQFDGYEWTIFHKTEKTTTINPENPWWSCPTLYSDFPYGDTSSSGIVMHKRKEPSEQTRIRAVEKAKKYMSLIRTRKADDWESLGIIKDEVVW